VICQDLWASDGDRTDALFLKEHGYSGFARPLAMVFESLFSLSPANFERLR